MKIEVKSIFKMKSYRNLWYFIREAEWQLKKKDLQFEEKLDDFFDIYNLLEIVGKIILKKQIF